MATIPAPQVLSSAHSPAEWETRCAQAALYRLLDHHGMSDLANQVVGARVKDEPDHYLLHQYGMFYEEITASSLIKTDAEGAPVDAAMPAPVDGAQNLAKWIFGARPEVNFFIHGHCEDIMAVSATKRGLQAVSQAAVYLMHLTTYIDYEFSEDDEYADKFTRTLGDNEIMITRNHGYYVLGRSASEAFFRTYYLRQACAVQVIGPVDGRRAAHHRPPEGRALAGPDVRLARLRLRRLDRMGGAHSQARSRAAGLQDLRAPEGALDQRAVLVA